MDGGITTVAAARPVTAGTRGVLLLGAEREDVTLRRHRTHAAGLRRQGEGRIRRLLISGTGKREEGTTEVRTKDTF